MEVEGYDGVEESKGDKFANVYPVEEGVKGLRVIRS